MKLNWVEKHLLFRLVHDKFEEYRKSEDKHKFDFDLMKSIVKKVDHECGFFDISDSICSECIHCISEPADMWYPGALYCDESDQFGLEGGCYYFERAAQPDPDYYEEDDYNIF